MRRSYLAVAMLWAGCLMCSLGCGGEDEGDPAGSGGTGGMAGSGGSAGTGGTAGAGGATGGAGTAGGGGMGGVVPGACGTTSGVVEIACSNSVSTAQSPFPNELTITVDEEVRSDSVFTVEASGVGVFPRFFIDVAQGAVPGGVRTAIVEGFTATVEANNGSGQILLQADPSGIEPGLTRFCTFPPDQTCAGDGDCTVAPCKPAVLVAGVPLSEDCDPGGFCESIGQGVDDGPTAQCNTTDPPEFCVAGDLAVPLYAPDGPELMTAGTSGDVVFNWAVDPDAEVCGAGSESTRCTGNGGSLPNGAVILPASVYGDPLGDPASVGLSGIRLNVGSALFVALQCSAGQDGGSCSLTPSTGCRVDADCPSSEICVGVRVDDDIIVATDLDEVPTRCAITE